MRWLIATSLKFRYLVIFATIVMVVFSIARLRDMPVDVFPEFAPPLVEIQTECPGMSTLEVEGLITLQLEENLNNIPGLDVMRSKSVPGLSSIRLIFKKGSDQMLIRQMALEQLAIIAPKLPPPADAPVMLPPLSSTSRVMKIGISSNDHSLEDLSMISYWTIALRLKQIPGVANVAIWGERWKMLTVQIDPGKMLLHGVSVDEVMSVVSETLDFGLLQYTEAAKMQVGGFVDTSNQRFGVEHISPVITPRDLLDVSIYDKKRSDGSPLLLGDVADVVWVHQPLIGDAVINDGEGLLLIVEKFPWGNTVEVTDAVEKALDEMSPGLAGIEMDTTIFRPATFIETSINNLTKALLFGAALVLLTLFVFLWDWRVALISSIIIPVSILISLLGLGVYGITINVMVLTGLMIAIGAIVDDAIVDVENVVRRFRQLCKNNSKKSISNIVLDASFEVRGVIIYASLIEVVALIPVFFMGGLSGSFFNPLASAYILAALVSPIIALTVTPALILIFLSSASFKHKVSPVMLFLIKNYNNALRGVMKVPRVLYTLVTIVVLSGFMVFPFLGQELLPSFKETDFLMHWLPKAGTSHPETVRITTEVSKELRSIPGVRNFGAHIGRAIAADEVVGVDFTENWVSIDPDVDYDKTVNAITETVNGYPGLVRDVQTYLKERIREVLTGSGTAIVVRVYGTELKTLRDIASNVKHIASQIDGIVDLHIERQVDIPQIEIKVDLDAAERYGVIPGDVRRATSALMNGVEVSDIHRDNKVYEVMVWSIPSSRRNLTDIQKLLINTPNNGYIHLEEIADISIVPSPNIIKHENTLRRIDVEANVFGRDIGSVVNDLSLALNEISTPQDHHIELLGEFRERQLAQKRVLIAGIFAVIGIFLILLTSFNSWRLATLSFLTLPMALSGGLLAAFFFGSKILSLGSLVGFLTILGVATRNGIMLISHYQYLEREEGMEFGYKLVLRGAKERLSPILMTAVTTALALIPLVVAGNIPGHEIEHPMAIVILGGLFSSTMLNLFFVPSLYLRFGKSRRCVHK